MGKIKFNGAKQPDTALGKMDAFTLAELLIVMATIAMLGALALPGIAKGQQKPQNYSCLNNQRQLALAALMYAADNGSIWLPNFPGQSPGWVGGNMTSTTGSTNSSLLLDKGVSAIAPYVKTAKMFRCPADPSTVNGMARVRSVSMNEAVGTMGTSVGIYLKAGQPVNGQWLTGVNFGAAPQTTFRTYGTTASMGIPGASKLWLFVDEHPNSINDASFGVDCAHTGVTARIIDFPASYHGGACGFSFCDGHAEMHKWQGLTFQIPYTPSVILNSGSSNISVNDNASLADLLWLQARTTVKF